jgi:hypothetical protein
MSNEIKAEGVREFLNEINTAKNMGFYEKSSMRFDEIFRAGIAYNSLRLGCPLSDSDPLHAAAVPPQPVKKGNKK